MNPADAFLVDLDGTLVDTDFLHDQALTQAARDSGGFFAQFSAKLYSGRSLKRLQDYARSRHIVLPGEPGVDAQVELIRARKWDVMADLVLDVEAEELDPHGWTERCLTALGQSDRPWCIVTDTPFGIARPITELLRVSHVELFTRDQVGGREKPDPALYRLAKAYVMSLGAESPIAIEDTLRGAHAASSAQIPTVLVPGGPKEFERCLTRWLLPGGSTTSGAKRRRSRKSASKSSAKRKGSARRS